MKKVKMLVLDEADVMLDMQGLADQTLRLQKVDQYSHNHLS